MADVPFDIQKAHCWFAVEFNNRAWDLVESSERSESVGDCPHFGQSTVQSHKSLAKMGTVPFSRTLSGESRERSSDETDEMISAAHAASVHWRAVGAPLNRLRAECLLATAYAAANHGPPAVHHAEKCLRLSGQVGEEQTPFDRAAAHGCAANAYAAAGEPDRARDHFRQLTELAAAITDADDRELLAKLHPAPAV